jgi:hypothetical protein
MTIIPVTGIFRYVKHRDAEAYCRLGWLPTDSLDGSYHGEFSVLMTWLCECKCTEPESYVSSADLIPDVENISEPTTTG